MLRTSVVCFFRGAETSQVDGHTGASADPTLFYFEPADYAGDALYSKGFVLVADCVRAAIDTLSLSSGEWIAAAVAAAEATTGWERQAAWELQRELGSAAT
jgi:hypothetical protein